MSTATPTPSDNLTKSIHIRDRWYDRMPELSRTYSHAWDHGTPVGHVRHYFEDKKGRTPHEMRLYHAVTCKGEEYTALILRRDDTLVTAYCYDGSVGDSRVEAYLDVMVRHNTYYE